MAFHEVQWYDRNPSLAVDYTTNVNIAPHISTGRWSYTVPKRRIAMVELLSLVIIRQTVAAAVGWAQNWVALTPKDGTPETILWCILANKAADSIAIQQISSTLMLFEGDMMEGRTSDSSPDGTCVYYGAYKITEFDAYLYDYPPITLPIPIIPPEDHPQEPGIKPDPEM